MILKPIKSAFIWRESGYSTCYCLFLPNFLPKALVYSLATFLLTQERPGSLWLCIGSNQLSHSSSFFWGMRGRGAWLLCGGLFNTLLSNKHYSHYSTQTLLQYYLLYRVKPMAAAVKRHRILCLHSELSSRHTLLISSPGHRAKVLDIYHIPLSISCWGATG